MKQKVVETPIFEPKLPPPPSFGQSLVEIARIIGPKYDYKRTLVKKDGVRQFSDEKGLFQETVQKLKEGEKLISE